MTEVGEEGGGRRARKEGTKEGVDLHRRLAQWRRICNGKEFNESFTAIAAFWRRWMSVVGLFGRGRRVVRGWGEGSGVRNQNTRGTITVCGHNSASEQMVQTVSLDERCYDLVDIVWHETGAGVDDDGIG